MMVAEAGGVKLFRDKFGGGYFISFFPWWWVPALAAIVAVAALPSVPYGRRIGVRGPVATVINRVLSPIKEPSGRFAANGFVMYFASVSGSPKSLGS